MYKLFKNIIIKRNYQFPLDLCTSASIIKCTVLNNYLYFRNAFRVPNFEPFRIIILYNIHNSLIISHPSRKNTFALLTRDFY